MKTMKFLILSSLLVICGVLFADTNVSGNIESNETWTVANSPYVVTGDVYVFTGITLTVEDGVTVKFNNSRKLYVYGAISALGTTNGITFTSVNASPSPGDWDYIQIGNTTYSGSATFLNCQIEYADHFYLYNGTASLTDCVLDDFYYYGVQILADGTLTMTNTDINFSTYYSSYGYGIYALANSDATLNNVNITGGTRGLEIHANAEVEMNDSTIENSYYYAINTAGTLTMTNVEIDITGFHPSNGVGINATSGAIADLDNVNISNCRNGLYVAANASVELDNSTITNVYYYGAEVLGILVMDNVDIDMTGYHTSYGYGLYIGAINANAGLTDCNIYSGRYPIYYAYPGDLTLSGTNSLTGNAIDAIYVTVQGNSNNWVLPTPSENDGINPLSDYVPYYFYYPYTVNTGANMDVGSNNILKFRYGSLTVNGSFDADADVGENIYFTSEKDDNWGGDTNNDGSATTPAYSNWTGIMFNDSSIDAECVLQSCYVRYAGNSGSGAVTMYNASPVIDNCDFSFNYYGVYMQYDSNPTFTNNIIGSSYMTPIAMSFDSNPTFSGNEFSFSDNQYDAIGLLGGTLSSNTVLPTRDVTGIPNVTYLLLNSITVPSGISLTINEGVVIKGYSGSHRIVVQGELIADGAPENMITFTSVKDDNYGNPADTNNNGSINSPVKGDWGGIIFESTSENTSMLDYCRVHYPRYSSSNYSGISILDSNPTISNCDIAYVDYGIWIRYSADPAITNNTITNSSNVPIALSIAADPTFTGNTFTNPSITALGIIGENITANGTIRERDVAGYDNITYNLLGNVTIDSGSEVTVDPGVVIKSNGRYIYVYGGFKAEGTSDSIIVFTSLYDDNYGNPTDTNGDGSATTPSAGNWGSIRYYDDADDAFTSIDYCLIKFAGGQGAITFTDASGTVSNSVISDMSSYGISCDGVSNPIIDNVEFRNSSNAPVAMSLRSNPTFTNITFTSNNYNGIRILEGTLSTNATLAKRDIAGINNIAYIIGSLTIASNATLTIDPGVVIKPDYYNRKITVNGAMIANGGSQPDEKIVFTSLKDDSYGGDTNNDGNSTAPARGNWGRIHYYDSDIDSLNILNNCTVRYGGFYDAIDIDGASVIIDSTIIEQSSNSGINISGDAEVSVTNCQIINVSEHGIEIYGDSNPVIDNCQLINITQKGIVIEGSAGPEISNCQISNIGYEPVYMSMFANPTFTNNTVTNVGYMAIGIKGEAWSATGTDLGGITNITYYLRSTNTISSGTTITIPEGVVFKNGYITVNGALIVEGTEAEPVVFTHLDDDDYGNPADTQGNGPTYISPYNYNSYRINFADISDDATCSVDNAILRYSNDCIKLAQASPTITNSLFNNNKWGINATGISEPVITDCTFDDLTYTPLYFSLVAFPSSVSGNVISGTTYKAIGIRYETLSLDWTMSKRDFAGITNIPYYFADGSGYTVGTNSILTIEPGVVLKFYNHSGNRLTVRKGLIAEGGATADSIIVFTSIFDDFYGGDTNADGDATSSSSNLWQGIYFDSESLGPYSRLQNCVVKDADIAVDMTNAFPTITHSLITNNRYGFYASGSSSPVINYCDIYDNYYYGINNYNQSSVIDAENNWWGDNSGPTHSGNPSGTGDIVSDAVDYTPWLGDLANNPIMGDVSLNTSITAYDASLVLQATVGSITLSDLQEMVADVSAASGTTAYDASLILQYVVGLIHWFPAEINRDSEDPLLIETLEYLALQKASNVILNIGSASAKEGEQVTIPLSVEDISGVTSFFTTLKYDSEILSINNISLTELSNDMNLVFEENRDTGELHIALAGTEILNTEGEILEITFDVAEDIKGTNTIPISASQFNANERDLSELTGSGEIIVNGIPLKFVMLQNFPNPFNPSTSIKYQIPENDSRVSICVYNVKGQLVKTLIDEKQDAGFHNVIWNGTDSTGNNVSSGVYFYRMESDKFSEMKKLILLK